jgi:cytochrome c oxidase assembly protein subunit 15
MTSAAAHFSEPSRLRTDGRTARHRAAIRAWLYVVAIILFGLFIVGGATRLTNSGLSITEWQPIHGVIPPLNDSEWQEEFAKYRQIPEYKVLNRGMDLTGFKHIFWWEWSHRLIARSVGFVFAVPLVFFWLAGWIERRLKPKLVGILALGGLQGAIGWWMVASGLVDRTDVSQYRLAIHLTTACLIFIATLAVARGLAPHSERPAVRSVQLFAGWMVALVLFQIYLGALVAGTDAGFSYNTWPLMDGRVVPDGLFILEPAWRNFFENPKMVQFVHRCGAYTVWIVAIVQMIFALSHAPGTTHARRTVVFFLLVTMQAALGITTLLMQVPIDLGLAHQALALVVLAFATAHWRGTKGAYPVEGALA